MHMIGQDLNLKQTIRAAISTQSDIVVAMLFGSLAASVDAIGE